MFYSCYGLFFGLLGVSRALAPKWIRPSIAFVNFASLLGDALTIAVLCELVWRVHRSPDPFDTPSPWFTTISVILVGCGVWPFTAFMREPFTVLRPLDVALLRLDATIAILTALVALYIYFKRSISEDRAALLVRSGKVGGTGRRESHCELQVAAGLTVLNLFLDAAVYWLRNEYRFSRLIGLSASMGVLLYWIAVFGRPLFTSRTGPSADR